MNNASSSVIAEVSVEIAGDSLSAPSSTWAAATACSSSVSTSAKPRARLLLAAVVPPHPLLWSHALRVVERLAHAPVFHLAWSPSEENARSRVTADA